MLGTIFAVFQAPGCNFALDDATLQSLLGSFGDFGDVKFEFEFENDGDNDNFDEGTELNDG